MAASPFAAPADSNAVAGPDGLNPQFRSGLRHRAVSGPPPCLSEDDFACGWIESSADEGRLALTFELGDASLTLAGFERGQLDSGTGSYGIGVG